MTATDRRFSRTRARKSWHCSICRKTIPPGFIHYYWHAGNPNGERRLCPECQDNTIINAPSIPSLTH
jgi:hypothetical protein